MDGGAVRGRSSRCGAGPRGAPWWGPQGWSRNALFLSSALAGSALIGCSSPRRPEPPPPAPQVVTNLSDPRALLPYLEQYPLADAPVRVDLLAATPHRSVHLLQTRDVIPSHYHPTRTEITYVLTGSGTCFVEGRSYPAVPGSAFKMKPRTVHSVRPAEGDVLVAVVMYEPPLLHGTDRVIVDEVTGETVTDSGSVSGRRRGPLTWIEGAPRRRPRPAPPAVSRPVPPPEWRRGSPPSSGSSPGATTAPTPEPKPRKAW